MVSLLRFQSFNNIFGLQEVNLSQMVLGKLKVLNKVVQVFLIGESTNFFYREILKIDKDLPIHNCLTLEKATKLALQKATISNLKNYVILLSPCAASFDQFKNFEDRGTKFKEIINKILNKGISK